MRTSNFISLTGNMGGDVEMRKPGHGEEVARLSVAETVSRLNSNTGEFEQIHTNWIPVTAFGNLARRAAQSLKKGDRVTIQGTLKTSSYVKNGENRRGFEVIASSIEKAQILFKTGEERAHELDPSQFPPFDEFKTEPGAANPMTVK